jgi:hypothetical protein
MQTWWVEGWVKGEGEGRGERGEEWIAGAEVDAV